MTGVAITTGNSPRSNWGASSDADLLAAACTQNQQAFTELMSRHYPSIYRISWRLCASYADAEDVTQEAFLKLWNNPQQLREAGALKGWLIRVATNLVMDRFRKKPMQNLEQAAEIADPAPAAPMIMDQNLIAKRMDTLIARLPDRQRLALTLVHFEQMTNIAAAAAMEISVDALESLLARARRGLKTMLAQDGKLMLAALAPDGA